MTGELFIPAFVEGYVAFGAGLGLDVVLGSLTGGIEAMGTAGLYGALSVIPELAYQDGQWSISGVATLAAGARLKLSLNAWAEIEALWVTVWDNTWELASVTMPIGPDLALQARMNYGFGRPDPPELEFSATDIDSESLIQSAMPEDGPPPSGAREALQNRAEWQGALREQRAAAVPADLASQAQQSQPAPALPPRPATTAGPPAGAGTPNGAASTASPPTASAPGGADRSPGPATASPHSPEAQAAATDDSLPAAVPEAQSPNSDQPRFSGPITLATLDELPVPAERSQQQMCEDLEAAGKVLDLAMAASNASDELAAYFPRIKQRFRLASLGYEGDLDSGFDIVARINPELRRTRLTEPLRGTGLLDTGAGTHVTKVDFYTSNLGGGIVGTRMVASPLGPDHVLGSAPRGAQPIMDQLGNQYNRGHLLNENLGGPGQNHNLFPITRSANAVHHTGIEDTVKQWVNSQRYWVRYEVAIDNISGLKTAADGLSKYVNADIKAKAQILNLEMEPWRTVQVSIPSLFDLRSVINVEDDSSISPRTPEEADLREVRQVDRDATVQVKPSHGTNFPAAMRADLADMLAANGDWNGVRALLMRADGVGPATVTALQHAFNATAQNYNGSTVELAAPLDKRLVTLAAGHWMHIMADLAKLTGEA
ncbi:DNA/RNA non-specific endonuclease [Glutamicibacter uratoxydans]|uniref:DNA/RNA non-specific endonuclease n=1 Tax=Glutamicibacter uratoxydans TaxID=43667 RepID=UPI003D6FA5F1